MPITHIVAGEGFDIDPSFFILLYVWSALPILLLVTAAVLLIRDSFQKRRRRSTSIVLKLAAVFTVLKIMLSSAI